MSADDEDLAHDYTPAEWEKIAASASFAELPADKALARYRHWLWADYSRQVFQNELERWELSLSDRFALAGTCGPTTCTADCCSS
jgi:hypothetical protein